ncbi:hypothetical protein L2E82_25226 [Cichorium intybus]|uniref:Uncharacterized protein n=1 Tax=Cichorium intybus TaxID=13427 RepID=A0ACB9E2X3_CICIN|nr:hypothetical protein L2E82_25226 [Cichorium intybus]
MSSVFGSGSIITSDEFLLQIHGFLQVHKDGRCERFVGNKTMPTGIDPSTGVQSKDVVISPETNLSARLYIPKTITPDWKLPILVYYHGGGFVVESAKSPTYHPTLNLITAESNVIIVSVDYRLGPEHPIPTGYNDSWEAIKWVATHSNAGGPEPWLNDYGDCQKVFLAGDSAGANIAHNMAIRAGSEPIHAIKLDGIILLHPYFGGNEPIGSELGKHKHLKAYTDQFWNLANASRSGLDDPLFNPEKNPDLSGLGCSKILLCVAEKDNFKDRGLYYKELMDKSGWPGKLEMMETKQEDHVFFLFNTSSHNSHALRKRIYTFINQVNKAGGNGVMGAEL